jgi:hypothetical protein
MFFFMNNPYKTKLLGMCDEFPNECNPHKDQVLGTWAILAQKYVSFISCILQVFCMMCGCCVRFYLCNLPM